MIHHKIEVAIVDDHQIVRQALSSLLNCMDNINSTILACDGNDIIDQIRKRNSEPDICIVDINMRGMNGFDTVVELRKRWPQIGILVLTQYCMEEYILKMIINGAHGYLLKGCSAREMELAINSIYHNKYYFSELVTSKLFHSVQNIKNNNSLILTEKEIILLKYCCTDLTYKEISLKMGATTRAIEGYRDCLFSKLNVRSRTSLALYAVKTGIVVLENN